jgi:hypothetical protein
MCENFLNYSRILVRVFQYKFFYFLLINIFVYYNYISTFICSCYGYLFAFYKFVLLYLIYDIIHLLTAIGLLSGGSSRIIHSTTQITTNLEECKLCPVYASFTLAFALQLRKKHGKTSMRVRKTSVRVQYTY